MVQLAGGGGGVGRTHRMAWLGGRSFDISTIIFCCSYCCVAEEVGGVVNLYCTVNG